MSVKAPQTPVDDANPVDIFHQFRYHSKPPDSEAFFLSLAIILPLCRDKIKRQNVPPGFCSYVDKIA
jgi:hypothetical protein